MKKIAVVLFLLLVGCSGQLSPLSGPNPLTTERMYQVEFNYNKVLKVARAIRNTRLCAKTESARFDNICVPRTIMLQMQSAVDRVDAARKTLERFQINPTFDATVAINTFQDAVATFNQVAVQAGVPQ